jgi:hypothetical protein
VALPRKAYVGVSFPIAGPTPMTPFNSALGFATKLSHGLVRGSPLRAFLTTMWIRGLRQV